uniref:Uncharacterized protein n=1 Tax=Peronospora matthiolae TaxID=2874970 RepID=A0AAV1U6N9_9STRA
MRGPPEDRNSSGRQYPPEGWCHARIVSEDWKDHRFRLDFLVVSGKSIREKEGEKDGSRF